MEKFCVVDARACCRNLTRFKPERLSFGRVGLVEGDLQTISLKGLVAEPDSTVPICILVHGYGFDMDRSVEDARWAISRINAASSDHSIQIVLFHWPSELEHSMPWLLLPRDIRRKGDRADVAGHHLAWLIDQLPPHQPVCIVGHSLGCRVAACALHLLGGGDAMLTDYPSGHRTDRPISAVFLAAAIDRDWLCPGERYGSSTHGAQEILVLTNRKDASLRWYPLVKLRFDAALGRGGMTPENIKQLERVGSRVRMVSVTDEIGSNHNFRNYMASESIANLLVTAVPTDRRAVRRMK